MLVRDVWIQNVQRMKGTGYYNILTWSAAAALPFNSRVYKHYYRHLVDVGMMVKYYSPVRRVRRLLSNGGKQMK